MRWFFSFAVIVVASCGGGGNTCGDKCDPDLACAAGTMMCGESPMCIDLATDVAHCGSCDNTCPADDRCVDGNCVCPDGKLDCNGTCVDATSDAANCGVCGNVCGAGTACTGGVCCPATFIGCGGACVDPMADAANCGACGKACDGLLACTSGTCTCPTAAPYATCGSACVDTDRDDANCGACGNACGGGSQCRGGRCFAETTVSILDGTPGGIGTIDRAGNAARLFSPRAMVSDADGVIVGDGTRLRKLMLPSFAIAGVAGSPWDAAVVDGIGDDLRYAAIASMVRTKAGVLYVGEESGVLRKQILAPLVQLTTVAGVSMMTGNVDGTGTAARFGRIAALAERPSDGTLFVADTVNCAVRSVSTTDFTVSTVAGAATNCTHVDGIGTAAGIAWRATDTVGIGFDKYDTLFLTEPVTHTIRRLDPQGNLTTFAGQVGNIGSDDRVGTGGRTASPGPAISDGTYLYFAEQYYGRIRKLAMPTGQMTTIAGSTVGYADGTGTDAKFTAPVSLAVAGGKIYVADAAPLAGLGVIREVDPATKAVTTAVGLPDATRIITGPSGASNVHAPVRLILRDQTLYIGEAFQLRKYDLTTGTYTSLFGNGRSGVANSAIGQLVDLFFDEAARGGLTFADASNNRIMRYYTVGSPGPDFLVGYVRGYADGTGSGAQLDTPVGYTRCVGGDGYIADAGNHRIRRVAAVNNATTTIAGNGAAMTLDGTGTAAAFDRLLAITCTPDGKVWIAENAAAGTLIRSLDPATAAVTTVVTIDVPAANASSSGLVAPYPLLLPTSNDEFLFTDVMAGTIRRIAPKSSAHAPVLFGRLGERGHAVGTLDDFRLNQPTGIVPQSPSGFFIADWRENVILKVQ